MSLLNNSSDLNHALNDGGSEKLFLRSGNGDARAVFEIEMDAIPFFANLTGTHPAYTEIRVFAQPLHLAYWSRCADLTFKPMGDFAAVNLDQAAYTVFDRVLFTSNLAAGQSHVGKKWNDPTLRREGIGVETTNANDGDSSYYVRFNDCAYAYLNKGWNVQAPASKGTVRWRARDNVWNACGSAIDATNMGELMLVGGNIQLHETGLDLKHCSNVLVEFTNFERGHLDVSVSPDCSEIDFLDARVTSVMDTGKRIRNRMPQHHRNVDSYK